MSRTKAKRSLAEYNEFYKYFLTEKSSNVIRRLTEKAKIDVLSLTATICDLAANISYSPSRFFFNDVL